MKLFFEDLATLHQFSISLDLYPDQTHCNHYSQKNQLVSHGFVYKKQTTSEIKQVGKRLLCSNRYGKLGCGRTIRLYLSSEIPMLQYSSFNLCIFISSLISKLTIQKAYEIATGSEDPRNSYRWLRKLWNCLVEYRQLLRSRSLKSNPESHYRTSRFKNLLPSLESLFSKLGEIPCSQYQLDTQSKFF